MKEILPESDVKVLNEESGVKNVHERLYEEGERIPDVLPCTMFTHLNLAVIGIILIKKQQVKQELSKQAEGMV